MLAPKPLKIFLDIFSPSNLAAVGWVRGLDIRNCVACIRPVAMDWSKTTIDSMSRSRLKRLFFGRAVHSSLGKS